MERTMSMPAFRTRSLGDRVAISGLFLLTSLAFAGCGAAPRTGPPGPAAGETPAPTSQGTPVSNETPKTLEIPATADAPTPTPHPAGHAPATRSSPAKAAPAESAPAPIATPTPAANESAPTPSPTVKPAASPAPTPPAAKQPIVVDVFGPVEVGATKPGLTRIGSDKCKLCHKDQFTSWAATAHAARNPPLDCESCHGPGSEYKSMAVMKDSSKARAAGLVTPGRSFCVTCHKSAWSDDLLKRAHAHKSGA